VRKHLCLHQRLHGLLPAGRLAILLLALEVLGRGEVGRLVGS
jgi:hypothetical protein